MRIAAVGLSALGIQAAGLVSAVGPDAGGFAAGDRVSYRTTLPELADPPAPRSKVNPATISAVVPERELIGFPKDVPLEAAAAYLPLGLMARAIVKQLHTIGRGNRVLVAPDESGADAFVAAWVRDLGATVVGIDDAAAADVVVTPGDYAAARRWRYANGQVQIASADVFAEVRRGIFDDIEVTSYPIADAERAYSDLEQRVAPAPIVLLPSAA